MYAWRAACRGFGALSSRGHAKIRAARSAPRQDCHTSDPQQNSFLTEQDRSDAFHYSSPAVRLR
jgi:hypothetical protein